MIDIDALINNVCQIYSELIYDFKRLTDKFERIIAFKQ